MKRMWMASLAIAAAMTVGCNRDHNGSTGTVGTSGRADSGVSSSDKNFVEDVSQMNADEIDLSRLATERASSPDVKKFAQMVLDDHTAAGEKLSGVASQNGISAVRGDLDDSHRKLHDKLAAKQGADFDKDYMDAMVDDHNKLVDKLESRIDKDTVEKWKGQVAQTPAGDKAKVDMKAQTVVPEKSDNPVTQSINAWAADTYPAAYAHLQSAKTLKDSLKRSTN
jgi:predicted outer membrane protein